MALTATLLTSAPDSDSAAVAVALKRAILADDASPAAQSLAQGAPKPARHLAAQVAIAAVETIRHSGLESLQFTPDHILCPLTLSLPDTLSFPGQAIYHSCQNVSDLQQRVAAQGYDIGDGDLWLPVVLTAKGPLYGEAIALSEDGSYQQPVHLSDAQRQPLYRLGRWLLGNLTAPPGVYLLQASCEGSDQTDDYRTVFQQLWPFPAAPALASMGRQSPDLFICHWRCLTRQPIRDLQIHP